MCLILIDHQLMAPFHRNKLQLTFLKSLVASPVFQKPELRADLLPHLLQYIAQSLKSAQDLVTALGVLGDILTTYQNDKHVSFEGVNEVC